MTMLTTMQGFEYMHMQEASIHSADHMKLVQSSRACLTGQPMQRIEGTGMQMNYALIP